MSTTEITSKIKELQALIEEAQAEAETIKDTIKAQMGDCEELRAGEYKNHMEARRKLQNRYSGFEKGNASDCRSIHQDHNHAPLLHCMRKAPCLNADQSHRQRA